MSSKYILLIGLLSTVFLLNGCDILFRDGPTGGSWDFLMLTYYYWWVPVLLIAIGAIVRIFKKKDK